MTVATQRRLAAIVAVDVVGYSRLMGVDEVGTLAALRRRRADLIDPKIAGHGGRIVKTMGDGLLLEFPSVIAAVECAVAIQRALAKRDTDIKDGRPIRYRIGIHVGDIIIEGDDIFGDGVNVAARVEPLADPGGIALSDDAYRQVRDRLEIAWRDGGERAAKNIARPIHVWHWSGVAPKPPAPGPEEAEPLALPEKPSIAVLPFRNMSGDPEQDYFADGMTEDLTTDLSKVSGIFVVARHSSVRFKGPATDVGKAARQLGVRYILEGSVRKAGSRVRINVQLVDAPTGGHVWAERYDGTVENVFELQDDVGANVVSALSVHLSGEERQRLQQIHTRNLQAYELFVRAKSTPYPPLPDRVAAARKMFEQVIDLDPHFAGGYAGLAWIIGLGAITGHGDVRAAADRAEALSRQAIELDDSFGMSYMTAAMALYLQGKYEQAVTAAGSAVARQPNDSDAHAYRGLILAFASHPALGVDPIETAIRLNPQFVSGPYHNLRSAIKLLARDYEGAARSYEENIGRHGPVGPPAWCWAAAAYWALGRHDEAKRAAGQLTSQFPDFRLSSWNFFRLLKSSKDRERVHRLAHAAGIPL